MALVERVRAPGSDYELELAKYLWEEYRYRHDLIWRLLFQGYGSGGPALDSPFHHQ